MCPSASFREDKLGQMAETLDHFYDPGYLAADRSGSVCDIYPSRKPGHAWSTGKIPNTLVSGCGMDPSQNTADQLERRADTVCHLLLQYYLCSHICTGNRVLFPLIAYRPATGRPILKPFPILPARKTGSSILLPASRTPGTGTARHPDLPPQSPQRSRSRLLPVRPGPAQCR